MDDLAEFIAPEFQLVVFGAQAAYGYAGARSLIALLRTAFPDLQHTVDDTVIEQGIAETVVDNHIVSIQKQAVHNTVRIKDTLAMQEAFHRVLRYRRLAIARLCF